jgi:hypothetical protein
MAALLLTLGVMLLVAPHAVPGLTIPGDGGGSMNQMGSASEMPVP